MKPRVEVTVAFLIGLIWLQQILCDDLSNTKTIDKWICSCSSTHQANQSDLKYICSTSCDCNIAAEQSSWWICICDAGGFPKVAAHNHDPNCFTACDCTYGFLPEAHASRKKDKCATRSQIFSPDRETSCNSGSNLISHKYSSVPDWIVNMPSTNNSVIRCLQKASFLFRNKKGNLNGSIIQFSFSQLEHVTNKFSSSNLVGVGGCSNVYRGQLKDGRIVAVKRLKTLGGPDADSVFSTEVELLARLHHCHVVPLLGYCSEFQGKHAERLLVFEYMPFGNLRDCLDGDSGENLNWEIRVSIAIGAARGLEYLHEAAAPRILHRDVKSTNILLDDNWRAKITDLGMAKCLKADGVPSCSSSPARMQGTFGYFAPEYAILGRASVKTDVFSFGVVLLELITGRRPINRSINKGEESLVIWATPRLQDSRRVILELPDPRLEGNFPEEEMQIMAYLAKECLLLDPDARPMMSDVLQILSTIVPNKSRRRNFQADFFQLNRRSEIQRYAGADEHRKPTSDGWSAQCSLPLDINCSIGSESKEIHTASTEYIERLVHMTSKARRFVTSEDVKVDLTEPRFESFCMVDLKT